MTQKQLLRHLKKSIKAKKLTYEKVRAEFGYRSTSTIIHWISKNQMPWYHEDRLQNFLKENNLLDV